MRKNFVLSEEYDLNCELKILADKTGLTFYTNYISQENSIYDKIEVGVELLDVIGAPVITICSGSLWDVDEYLQTVPNNITEFLFSLLCDYTDILEEEQDYIFVIYPQNNGNFSIDIKDWETEDSVDGGYNLTFAESLSLLQEYASY